MAIRPAPIGPNLFASVSTFRVSLQKWASKQRRGTMARFPHDCCLPASQLLAQYLVTELRMPMVTFVRGEREHPEQADRWQSHMWLRALDYFIDITADQYPEVQDPIMVMSDSEWHATFLYQVELPYGEVMYFNRAGQWRFNRAYREVLRTLPRVQRIRSSPR